MILEIAKQKQENKENTSSTVEDKPASNKMVRRSSDKFDCVMQGICFLQIPHLKTIFSFSCILLNVSNSILHTLKMCNKACIKEIINLHICTCILL